MSTTTSPFHDELDESAQIAPRHSAPQAHAVHRVRLVRRALLAADIAGLSLACAITGVLSTAWAGSARPIERQQYVLLAATAAAWILIATLCGLYSRDRDRIGHTTVDDVAGVFFVTSTTIWLLYVFAVVTSVRNPSGRSLVTFWASSLVCIVVCRLIARAVYRRNPAYVQNAVLVGTDEVAELIARKLLKHREYGINLIGVVDGKPSQPGHAITRLANLGSPSDLPTIVRKLAVERVICAFPGEPGTDEFELMRSLTMLSVRVDIVLGLHDVSTPHWLRNSLEGLPVVSLSVPARSRVALATKRAIDVVVSATALILLLPLFAYIAVRIKLDSNGPVIFRQPRLGQNMRKFTLLKFRTMKEGTSSAKHEDYIRHLMNGATQPEATGLFKLDPVGDVTHFGSWLRRKSLDELPQLINVLRGEMSLVGPRPCLDYEVEHFAPYHFERFAVPAGMTGLWQVVARGHSTFGEALDMDVAYARGWSLALDIRLLVETPLQVLRHTSTS